MEGLFTTFMEIGLECFNSHGVLMLSPGAPSPNPCYTNLSWFTSLLWAGSFHLPAVMSCHFSFSRIFLLLLLSLFLIFFCVSLFSSVVSRERNGILIPTIAYFYKRNKEHEFRLRLRISFLLGIEMCGLTYLTYKVSNENIHIESWLPANLLIALFIRTPMLSYVEHAQYLDWWPWDKK